ncbi:unnamed protein product [Prorocentrum cordatum]|uniref:Uncharacterized protein n=1 Tax=Prorocentrum cordatum TaxID=2364126 RepID=A0ABN9XK67_9DINO|nr:unnamed protein product [Polarella glacialis]
MFQGCLVVRQSSRRTQSSPALVPLDRPRLLQVCQVLHAGLDLRGGPDRQALALLRRDALPQEGRQRGRPGGQRRRDRAACLRQRHAPLVSRARDQLRANARQRADLLVAGSHRDQPEAPDRVPAVRPDSVGYPAAFRRPAGAVRHAPGRRQPHEGGGGRGGARRGGRAERRHDREESGEGGRGGEQMEGEERRGEERRGEERRGEERRGEERRGEERSGAERRGEERSGGEGAGGKKRGRQGGVGEETGGGEDEREGRRRKREDEEA